MLTVNQQRELVRRRVLRGVRLLDRTMPGWRQCVDSTKLAMNDCYSCVLGQVWGHYVSATSLLGLTPRRMCWYGFNCLRISQRLGSLYEEMLLLQEEWLKELRDGRPATITGRALQEAR